MPRGTNTLVWPEVTEVHGIAAAVPARYSIVSASIRDSVKPSKRAVAAIGVAGRRGSVKVATSESGDKTAGFALK